MSDAFNVLMVGVGGQGIVLASDILAEAALADGLDVKKSEIHGMAVRGGPVFSHVRFGKKVHAPVISAGEADVIFALERMEVLRWCEWGGPDCTVCYLDETILPTGETVYPEGISGEIDRLFSRVVRIDPRGLKQAGISKKAENTALLGSLSTVVPLSLDSLLYALKQRCPKDSIPLNLQAFEKGLELARIAVPERSQEGLHVE